MWKKSNLKMVIVRRRVVHGFAAKTAILKNVAIIIVSMLQKKANVSILEKRNSDMKTCTIENVSLEIGSCLADFCCTYCEYRPQCNEICRKAYGECEYRKDVKNEYKN